MLPREAPQLDEQSNVPSGFDFDEAEIDESLDATGETFEESPANERRSWRRVCEAKRSIERLREQQALRADLVDVFDEDDDYAELSGDD